MLVVKALHIISVVTWFAGLFYLPRLFVSLAGHTGRSRRHRAVQAHGAQALPRHHDARRLAHRCVRRVAVARLRLHRQLAARQADTRTRRSLRFTSTWARSFAISPRTAIAMVMCSIAG